MSVFVKCEYEEIRCQDCVNMGKPCFAINVPDQYGYWFIADCCENYKGVGMREDRVLDGTCVNSYKVQKAMAKSVKKFNYEEDGCTTIGNTRIPNALIGYLSVDFGDHTEVYINKKAEENSKEEKTT